MLGETLRGIRKAQMAGPLSTNEIEDVVSSVRRLVSTEQRPKAVSRHLGDDRLLLTPSLRVVADNQFQGSAGPTEPAPLILTTPDRVDLPRPPEAGFAVDDRLHLVEAEWEDEIWTAPEPPLAELALGAEEAEVVLPDAAPPIAVWPESEVEWTEEPPIPFTAFADAPEAAKPTPDVQAAVPDGPISEGAAQPEDQELDVADMLTAAVVEDEAFNHMTAAELHALVRAMVRDELQGSLGERITRNVRKLVRAEINRALAARSLD
jgi:hypothetical protein